MLISDIDTIEPLPLPIEGPVALYQRTSRMAVIGLGLGAAFAIGLLLMPFWFIGAHLISNPLALATFTERLTEHPATLIQLSLGLVVVLAFAGFVLRRLLRLIGSSREIYLEAGIITVVDSKFGRELSRWQQPAAAYCGYARLMRSTAFGIRHEIALVHPDATRNLVLVSSSSPIAAKMPPIIHHLHLPEVPACLLDPSTRTNSAETNQLPPFKGEVAA